MAKPRLDPSLVTGALTSCGRPDLLEETLASLAFHAEPCPIVLTEDAADPRVAELCARRFPFVRVLMNSPKLGQMASIDRIYAEVATPYVLHLEDDWRFDAAPDLAAAVALLEARADVSAVCLRAFAEVKPRLRERSDAIEIAGERFAAMRADADENWFGYTFNPSIVRRSFWEAQGGFARFRGEEGLSRHAKDLGLRVAYLLPGCARHIGGGRNVPDPVQGMADRGWWSRARGRARRLWRAANPFTYAKRSR